MSCGLHFLPMSKFQRLIQIHMKQIFFPSEMVVFRPAMMCWTYVRDCADPPGQPCSAGPKAQRRLSHTCARRLFAPPPLSRPPPRQWWRCHEVLRSPHPLFRVFGQIFAIRQCSQDKALLCRYPHRPSQKRWKCKKTTVPILGIKAGGWLYKEQYIGQPTG